jgi:signal transduction histidine kinase
LNFIITKSGLISISLEKRIENKDDTTSKIVLVQIKDNGQGINPKVIPNLFTKSASNLFYGTGMGLYVCKEIIEMHQGKIWGRNNDEGQGATFSFELPLIN